ncbi:hypothetical protein [Methylobacterium indicum]|uniref:Uncharacterized protein n=1 Tax=Methylobacterium indicum TaxID=1775910 RepID=A0A8H8X0L2_9HYPH|nr:hypothetical protein [Methylobacterium indicum]BCM87784.1 hypothetical protein mvi_62450 [Methylobacterium indicum]
MPRATVSLGHNSGTLQKDHTHDDQFDELVRAIQARLDRVLNTYGQKLFTTRIPEDALWQAFLNGVPAEQRQYHTCNCCKGFVRRFGGLVAIGEAGDQHSAFWSNTDVPAIYLPAIREMHAIVDAAPVDGVFVNDVRTWGIPEAGGFTHFAVRVPAAMVHRNTYNNAAHQVMAQKRQDFGTLQHGLADFDRELLGQAMTILTADAVKRSEKFIAPTQFLLDLHAARGSSRGSRANNLVWRAVASAPVGFCTPRSGMIGTLLEDLASGMSFESVRSRWNAKVHPLAYQRPQAAPTAGNVAAAEKLFAEMGLAPSLERRYARFEELPREEFFWLQPMSRGRDAPGDAGLFGDVVRRSVARSVGIELPLTNITWRRFNETVLPNAIKIEVLIEPKMHFYGLLTASDPEAPPILRWDREDRRNPFSWFLYAGGSSPDRWALRAGAWVNVPGVLRAPAVWNGMKDETFQMRAMFVLEGAHNTGNAHLNLFPEMLRSELHPVRSTIEAYNATRHPSGAAQGTANGLLIGGREDRHRLRVTTELGQATYHVDRWE